MDILKMSKRVYMGTFFGGNIQPLQRVVGKNRQVENHVGILCRGLFEPLFSPKINFKRI